MLEHKDMKVTDMPRTLFVDACDEEIAFARGRVAPELPTHLKVRLSVHLQ